MKKLIAFALVAMILGTSVIGCGGSGTTKTTEAKTEKKDDKK